MSFPCVVIRAPHTRQRSPAVTSNLFVVAKDDTERVIMPTVTRDDRRPNFLVIGAGKCGTTTLCGALARHPDVFVCTPKEPNFLAYEDIYARGWDWYESLFEAGRGAHARGEGSVAYTAPSYEARVIERIKTHLPDVKLLYIVRSPLERIVSAYRELHSNGPERGQHIPYSLRAAMDTAFDELLAESMYTERLSRYQQHFPAGQIRVVFLEDLKRDPEGELRRCLEFIGVDPSAPLKAGEVHLNQAQDKVRDTRLMRILRTQPWLMDLGRRVPGLKSSARRVLRRPFDKPVEWDRDARAYALSQVTADARAFLAQQGKPTDFWQLV